MSAVLRPRVERMPMRAEHLDEIHRIEIDIYDHPWTRGNLHDAMNAGYDCSEYRLGAQLIGYSVMMFGPGEAHLLNLSIARVFQRQGFGYALLAELCTVARGQSSQALLLEVRPTNVAAQALYARAGFVEVGIRRGYYPGVNGREDAIVLKLAL